MGCLSGKEKRPSYMLKNSNSEKAQFIKSFNQNDYSKIIFVVGAGISVASGYQDFRTPGTGLFSNLKKYNIDHPEQIFELQFFRKNPKPFFKYYKEILEINAVPSLSHIFIAEIQKRNKHLFTFSQNFDSLELKAGLNEDQIVQAHGNLKSAHCIVKSDKIPYCEQNNCSGVVKPDIIFFGEDLPEKYYQNQRLINQADLIFVMGTSLLIQPFAQLLDRLYYKTQIILINMEEVNLQQENVLFFQGDVQEILKDLVKQFNWNLQT